MSRSKNIKLKIAIVKIYIDIFKKILYNIYVKKK